MFMIAVLGLLGGSALIALASPYLVMRAARLDAGKGRHARRYLLCSGVVVLTLACAKVGLSFAGHAANIVSVVIAMAAAGALALFSFRMEPRWLGAVVGPLSMIGCLFALVFLAMTAKFDGNSPFNAELGNGLHCRATMYGFVSSDSGRDLEVFRRYLWIDYRVYYSRESDIYLNAPERVPDSLRTAVAGCRTLLGQ